MRRTKALCAAVAAMAVMVPLAACGSNGAEAEAPEDRTHVRFWWRQWQDWEVDFFEEQIEEFNNSQEEIWVTFRSVDMTVWEQNLQAAQAAGEAPDVVSASYGALAAGAREGQFAPLNELISQAAQDDILENVRDMVTLDGNVYAYPLLVEPSQMLFINKSMATEAGLDVDNPPTTWEELYEWARALTTDDRWGINVASGSVLEWMTWGQQWGTCGHLGLNEDWSQSMALEPCMAEIAEFYRTFWSEGLMNTTPTVGANDAEPYVRGEVAMMANGSWAVANVQEMAEEEGMSIEEHTLIVPMPTIDGDLSRVSATNGGWTMAIDTMSQVQDEAAEFIEWLAGGDPDRLVDFYRGSGFGQFAVRNSVQAAVAADPEVQANPYISMIADEIVPIAGPEPTFPHEVNVAIAQAFEAVMTGLSSPEDAFREANTRIETVIQDQDLAGQGS